MGNPVKDEGGALGCITLVAFAAFLMAVSRLGDNRVPARADSGLARCPRGQVKRIYGGE